MRFAILLMAAVLLGPAAAQDGPPELNVNTRYAVESVNLSVTIERKLSRSLRDDLDRLVGERFDPDAVREITERIRHELPGYRVEQKIVRGSKPDTVRVVVEVFRFRKDRDVVVPRLVYHSRQNLTFGVDAEFRSGGHQVSFGILTDNDELLERYSGFRGGYERSVFGDRLRAGFLAETWRSQWSPAVETALAGQVASGGENVPGIYRKRQSFLPTVHVELAPGLEAGAGVSLQRFQMQYPDARYETAHALTGSLRLDRQWSPGRVTHEIVVGYDVKAATEALDSDFRFTRHAFEARYGVRAGSESLDLSFRAGSLSGRAPLADRFVLGNSTTLRGYNKYDITPLGGNRMAHGSFDYRHAPFRIVYDVGTIHQRGEQAKIRHSIAAGFTTGKQRESFSFLVAFPLTKGRATPIFIMGIHF